MIYFTSDLHGEWNFKGFQEYLSKAREGDLLIILGDVGLSFEKTEEIGYGGTVGQFYE